MYTVMSMNESKLPAGEIVLMKIDGNTETLSFEQFFEAWKLNRGKPKRVARVNS